jgi:hypothetical protein
VSLGLCTAEELEKAIRRAQRRIEREAKAGGKPPAPGQNFGAPAIGGVQAAAAEDDEDLDDEELDEAPESNKAAEG